MLVGEGLGDGEGLGLGEGVALGARRVAAMVVVDAGICGFQTRIHAESDDTQNVTFKITSGCEKARTFGEALTAKGPVDGYAEIGAGADGTVLSTARETLKGCCAACAARNRASRSRIRARSRLPKARWRMPCAVSSPQSGDCVRTLPSR